MKQSRPTKRPDDRAKQVSIRLSANLQRRLKVHCARRGETTTACLTRLIEAELKSKKEG